MEEQRKYLTEQELAALLQVIDSPRDKAIFTVSYWRGLRASEVGRLTFASFDARNKKLYVRRLKGSLAGEFLLSPPEMRALTKWIRLRGDAPGPLFPSRELQSSGRGIGRRRLDQLMKAYAKMAALPVHLRHYHALKHSIATHLLGKMDVMAVRDWVGHKDIKSTMVYAQWRSRARDAAARSVYEDVA